MLDGLENESRDAHGVLAPPALHVGLLVWTRSLICKQMVVWTSDLIRSLKTEG